jgi:hypothetical protein
MTGIFFPLMARWLHVEEPKQAPAPIKRYKPVDPLGGGSLVVAIIKAVREWWSA